MSVVGHKLHWTKGGDPVLTVVATGTHDVYRLAHHLQHGQVELCAIGGRALRGLWRRLGKEGKEWLLRYMHGDGGFS